MAEAISPPQSPAALELERKLQMVRWQKEQNRMQMQTTLGLVKKMHEIDAVAQMVADPRAAALARSQAILEDELAQPMPMTRDEMEKLMASENLDARRRTEQRRSRMRAEKKIAVRAKARERADTYKAQRSVLEHTPTPSEVDDWEAEFEAEYSEKLAAAKVSGTKKKSTARRRRRK
jgi:hypothetical protein